MNNEEYVRAQQVIAESTTTLAVQALQEANEELQVEVAFLKEELSRQRRAVKATRTTNRMIRSQATDLIKQVEEMGTHIFDIAAQEAEIEDQALVDAEPVDPRTLPGGVCGSDIPYAYDEEEKRERDAQAKGETFTRNWVDKAYQDMRAEGTYPEKFPLSPAEVFKAAQEGITAAINSASTPDGAKTT